MIISDVAEYEHRLRAACRAAIRVISAFESESKLVQVSVDSSNIVGKFVSAVSGLVGINISSSQETQAGGGREAHCRGFCSNVHGF